MKKIVLFLLTFGTLFFHNTDLLAQGEAAMPFLLIAPHARNGAMGEGGVALVNDAAAVYWNPAGLAFQYLDPEVDNRNQITLMHSKWLPQFNFNDLYYEFMAGRFSLGDLGMLGASITFLNLGENVWTDEIGNELGTFNSFEYAIAVSYATKLQENLSVGLNAKIVQSNLSDVSVGSEEGDGSATSFAVDLGMLWIPDYEFLGDRLSLGFNLSNFGPKVTYIDKAQADPMPTNLRLGLAVKAYDDGFNKINVIYDLNRLLVYKYKEGNSEGMDAGTSDNLFKSVFYNTWVKGSAADRINSFTQSFGLEYRYGTLIAIRGGYFYEDPNHGDRKFMTFGAGLAFSMFNFDFSYIAGDDDNPLSETIRISIGVNF